MMGRFALLASLLLSAGSAQTLVDEPEVKASIVANNPCFQKGEIISASFQNIIGIGVSIGLYPKNSIRNFDTLPPLEDGKASNWTLTCGSRDCDKWLSKGVVEFETDDLTYGQYVLAVSGFNGTLTSQAYSETFIVDAYCANRNEWIPARVGDQRSPCPFLNVAANHGFINRHGANIDIDEMADTLEALYNVDADFLHRGPIKQLIDCGQIFWRGGVRRFNLDILFDGTCEEHEASMVRADSYYGFEKSKLVDDGLLNNLMRKNPGKSYLTFDDVMDYQADRIMTSRMANPETEFRHFDINNMGAQALLLFMVGTDPTLMTVEKSRLYFFLLDEKLPDDFVPGALRDRPFNPKRTADFTNERWTQSKENVKGMMEIPIGLGLKLGYGTGQHIH